MLHSTSRSDFLVALLIAAVVHVLLFFAAAAAVAYDLIQGEIEPREEKEKKDEPVRMTVVYEEDFLEIPEVVGEPVEVVPATEPEPEKEEEANPPAFVQTRADQEVEELKDDTNLIGERNTRATSDEGAIAGDEDMAALNGEEDRKSDPKTFDSNFSKGERSGEAMTGGNSLETGKGLDDVNQEKVDGEIKEMVEANLPEPAVEETAPSSPREKLPTIDNALAALDEEIGEQPEEKKPGPVTPKVEENLPPRPKVDEREASNQDGGFAPRSRKTRVAGVISARGAGSLNVSNTAVGRYQAAIFKKLETAWQMENISNRSLLAPGNITLYFVVGKSGQVSRQKQVAMVGASGTQWGMILRALNGIRIPKMPRDVVRELEGDPLEIIVTFNY